MPKIIRRIFLFIIFFQVMHSIEEYYGKLWTVLEPARFMSSLFSFDLRIGFIIFNSSFLILMVTTWLLTKKFSLTALLWFWAIVEMLNGMAHIGWSILEKNYKPGLITAPFLLFCSIGLMRLMIKDS